MIEYITPAKKIEVISEDHDTQRIKLKLKKGKLFVSVSENSDEDICLLSLNPEGFIQLHNVNINESGQNTEYLHGKLCLQSTDSEEEADDGEGEETTVDIAHVQVKMYIEGKMISFIPESLMPKKSNPLFPASISKRK